MHIAAGVGNGLFNPIKTNCTNLEMVVLLLLKVVFVSLHINKGENI